MSAASVLCLILVLGLAAVSQAYTTRVSLCLCGGTETGLECGFLDGVLYNGKFVYVDASNKEFSLFLEIFPTYPRHYCSHPINKRFLVDLGPIGKLDIDKDGVSAGVAGVEVGVGKDGVSAGVNVDAGPLGHLQTGVTVGPDGANANLDGAIHAGVVDANGQLNVDTDGHASGGIGGTVNVAGVEVGGNVNVSEKGEVSGGGSLGVGLGSLGGVNIHVTAGPDGVKTGVGAHIDAGPVHGYAGVDVDQNGKVDAGANVDANLGPLGSAQANIGIDSNGNVNGGASGNLGVGPASLQGGVNVNNGQVSGNLNGNVGVGPGNIGGSLNVGSNGQVSGGLSGSVGSGPLSAGGNLNVGSNGQVSGNLNGNVGVGPGNIGGSLNLGSNGQVSGGLSGSVGSGPLSAGGNLNVGSNGQVSGGLNVGPLNVGFGSGSSSSSSGSGGSQSTGGSSQSSTGQSSGNTHPDLFNPGAMMSNLPQGGQQGLYYNPSTFYQQAGYQEFLKQMGYNSRK